MLKLNDHRRRHLCFFSAMSSAFFACAAACVANMHAASHWDSQSSLQVLNEIHADA
jgi:hypothetical protein